MPEKGITGKYFNIKFLWFIFPIISIIYSTIVPTGNKTFIAKALLAALSIAAIATVINTAEALPRVPDLNQGTTIAGCASGRQGPDAPFAASVHKAHSLFFNKIILPVYTSLCTRA